MIGLLCLVVAVLVLAFKSTLRLEVENAVLLLSTWTKLTPSYIVPDSCASRSPRLVSGMSGGRTPACLGSTRPGHAGQEDFRKDFVLMFARPP